MAQLHLFTSTPPLFDNAVIQRIGRIKNSSRTTNWHLNNKMNYFHSSQTMSHKTSIIYVQTNKKFSDKVVQRPQFKLSHKQLRLALGYRSNHSSTQRSLQQLSESISWQNLNCLTNNSARIRNTKWTLQLSTQTLYHANPRYSIMNSA